ncbi:MAG: insulinase family protein [Deltaproteobacteria bacterium]|nr:insulinase family protein [Deltaproteobacteria bacterium]
MIEHRLDNGLRVIIEEMPSSTSTSVQMWVHVGSADELQTERGISHFFEHMLFKEPEHRSALAESVEAAGGDINAFTAFDHTVYHITIASRYTHLALKALADAIQHPAWSPLELEREKEVILEEWRRFIDSPQRASATLLFETLFRKHPYRHPVIGELKTIQSISIPQMKSFYRKWYRPSRMTLVVAGAVHSSSILKKIEKDFSSFSKPVSQSPLKHREKEPVQRGFRAAFRRRDVSELILNLCIPIPGVTDPAIPSLELAASVLGEGGNSRLYKRLYLKEGLVNAVSASTHSLRDSGIFAVTIELKPQLAKEALRSLSEELRLLAETIHEEERASADLNIQSELLYQRENPEERAHHIGYYFDSSRDVGFEEKFYRAIHQTSVTEVKEEIRRFLLKPESMNVTAIVPLNYTDQFFSSDSEFRKETHQSIAEGLQSLQPQPKKRKSQTEKQQEGVIASTLSNGTILLLKYRPHAPIFSMRAFSLGGLRYETKENNGIFSLLARMMTQGTKTRSSIQMAREIEGIAGSIGGFSGRNAFGLSLEALSQHWPKATDLFFDALTEPAFPEMEFERERDLLLEDIKQQDITPSALVGKLFTSALFANHPYSLPLLGKKETVSRFKRSHLESLYGNLRTAQGLVISAVGHLPTQEFQAELESRLESWPEKKVIQPRLSDPAPPRSTAVHAVKEREQTHLLLGFLGIRVTDKKRYALQLLQSILSGQGGRLFKELRDRQSLAYTVTPQAFDGIERGYFAIYLACDPAKVKRGVEGILVELQKTKSGPPKTKEMDRAKKYLIGRYELALQYNRTQAHSYGIDELFGLGHEETDLYPEKIAAVSLDNIVRAAQDLFDFRHSVLATVGPRGIDPSEYQALLERTAN